MHNVRYKPFSLASLKPPHPYKDESINTSQSSGVQSMCGKDEFTGPQAQLQTRCHILYCIVIIGRRDPMQHHACCK